MSDADVFLESDAFKKYEKIVKADGTIIKNAPKALTVDERKEYFSLMKSVTPNTTDDEYNDVIQKIKVLTGVDTDLRIKKLHDARAKMMENVAFSKKELLQAMQRHCLNMKKVVSTRSYDEIDYVVCRNECSNIYARVYSECDPTGGMGMTDPQDYDLWCQLRYCEMAASDAYDECMMGCE